MECSALAPRVTFIVLGYSLFARQRARLAAPPCDRRSSPFVLFPPERSGATKPAFARSARRVHGPHARRNAREDAQLPPSHATRARCQSRTDPYLEHPTIILCRGAARNGVTAKCEVMFSRRRRATRSREMPAAMH